MLKPTQDKLQAYYHNIEAGERAAVAVTTTTDASDPGIPSEEPPSVYPTYSNSDDTSKHTSILLSTLPLENPLE